MKDIEMEQKKKKEKQACTWMDDKLSCLKLWMKLGDIIKIKLRKKKEKVKNTKREKRKEGTRC